VFATVIREVSSNVYHFSPISNKIVSISFNFPLASNTLTPILANASVYLVNPTPSSNVLPSFKLCKRAKIVLKPVPTVSAL